MSLGQPTRDRAALLAALSPELQSTYGDCCGRLAKALGKGEIVHALATCDSGGAGVVAVTPTRLLFAPRSGKTVFFNVSSLTAAWALTPALFNVRRQGHDGYLAFKDVTPAEAEGLVQQLWAFGVPEPTEEDVPQDPPVTLPASDIESLVRALPEADRDSHRVFVEHLADVLDDGEQVRLVAACQSGTQRLVALTDRRVLCVGPSTSGQSILVSLVPFTAITYARPIAASALGLGLNSTNWPKNSAFENMRPRISTAFAEQLVALGIAPSPVAADVDAGGADQSALRVLPAKTLNLVKQNIAEDEPVFVCLVGAHGQSLVALADRLIIAKAGFMSGNVFGGKVTAFPYREITGIEIHSSMMTAVLAVQTPSYPGTTQGGYWSSGKGSPQEQPNMIPLASKSAIAQWQPHLATLRRAITSGGLVSRPAESKFGPPVAIRPIEKLKPPAPPPQPGAAVGGGIAAEIQKLAELHSAGILTDEEFSSAKAKLLS